MQTIEKKQITTDLEIGDFFANEVVLNCKVTTEEYPTESHLDSGSRGSEKSVSVQIVSFDLGGIPCDRTELVMRTNKAYVWGVEENLSDNIFLELVEG